MRNPSFSVSLLMTGDEIMSGNLTDTNSSFICRELYELGGMVSKTMVTGDDPEHIISALTDLTRNYSLVIINGGLGPTDDDHTVDCVCKAFVTNKVLNKDAMAHLEKWVNSKGYPMNNANKKQAYLPENCEIIDNNGSCCGFFFKTGNAMLIATPGVPGELKYMWYNRIREYIAGQLHSQKVFTKIFRTFGIGESLLQEKINESAVMSDSRIKLGFRASTRFVDVKLTGVLPDDADEISRLSKQFNVLFGNSIISNSDETLAHVVYRCLKENSCTLSTAESCTGGEISALFTKIPGISSVFKGGLVTYSNELKIKLLGIPAEIIEKFGAVSKETAKSMLENIQRITGSDYAISVTGIAGPDGGSEEKPVGTVFIGIGSKKRKNIYRIKLQSERERIIQLSSFIAIDLLRRLLLDINEVSDYYFDICKL